MAAVCSLRIVCATRAPKVKAAAAESDAPPPLKAGANYKNLKAAVDAGLISVRFLQICRGTRSRAFVRRVPYRAPGRACARFVGVFRPHSRRDLRSPSLPRGAAFSSVLIETMKLWIVILFCIAKTEAALVGGALILYYVKTSSSSRSSSPFLFALFEIGMRPFQHRHRRIRLLQRHRPS
jgi:hypothetical protein